MTGLGEKTIFIRLSTSEVHGMGHISRMLAFRREVKYNVVWFVDPGTSNRLSGKLPVADKIIQEKCTESIIKLLSHYRRFRCDLVVCDSHQIKQDAFDCMSCKVVFFNDRHVVATRKNFVHVNFQPKTKLGKKHVSGLKYLPIDTRGKFQKQINFDNVGRHINCLIAFGAVDSKDNTCLVLNAIASSDNLRSAIRPICLVGENYRGLAELKKMLGKFEHSVILSGLNSILDVPIACFIGIGAPGVSHVERLFLGVPTILIPQKHVHIDLCRQWEEIGCATWSLPHPDEIVAKIYEMIDYNFAVGRALSKRGQRLVDGKGVKRLVNEVFSSV